MELEPIDKMIPVELRDKFGFAKLCERILSGDWSELLRGLGTFFSDLLWYEWKEGRILLVQIVMLAIAFAVCNRLWMEKSQVSGVAVIALYAGMSGVLLKSYQLMESVFIDATGAAWDFMTALIPVYATCLTMSGAVVTGGIFCEFAFGMLWFLQLIVNRIMIPLIRIYVLVQFVDSLFLEQRFGGVERLLYRGITVLRKAVFALVLGIGSAQSIVGATKDRIDSQGVVKAMEVIPGIGDVIGGSSELLLSCGMLLKNAVGIVGVVILVLLIGIPLLKLVLYEFIYRGVEAIVEPISGKEIVGGVHSIAMGMQLCFQVLWEVMLICVVAISLVLVSSTFTF